MTTSGLRHRPPARTALTGPGGGLRRDIQGLRALAVLLVVAAHLSGRPAGGFVGVDVFFVISGYLITGLLLRSGEERGRPSLVDFYGRRARRILPAGVLVLLVTAVATRLLLSPLRARQAQADSLWALLFGANVHFSRLGTDYFQQDRPVSPVQHYWSLSVEEQFYLLWPLMLIGVFLVARRSVGRARRLTVVVALAGSAASLAWAVHATRVAPISAYFSTAARAWEIGLGAALAAILAQTRPLGRLAAAHAAWVGLGMIAFAALAFDAHTAFPGIAALLPVAGASLVLAAQDPPGGPGRVGLLNNVVAQYLGRISYSLYLWHFPCIVLAGSYFGARGAGYYLCAGLLPFALAVVSFHLVEDPLRSGRRRALGRHQRHGPGWSASSLGVSRRVSAAACLVLLIGMAAPFPLPTAPNVALPAAPRASRQLVAASAVSPIETALHAQVWPTLDPSPDNLDTAGSPEWLQDHCLNVSSQRDMERCTYGDPAGPRLLVVMGDSMAASYMPGLRLGLRGRGWRIVMLTFQECPNVLLPSTSYVSGSHHPYRACLDHRQFAINEVRRLRPDVVVTSSLSTLFVDRIVGVAADRRLAAWTRGTREALGAVAGWTKRLVLLAGPPNGSDLQTCRTPRSVPRDCVSPVPADWYPLAEVERAAAASVGAVYVSPLDWLCSANECPSFIGGTPVRWDAAHLTAAFARTLGVRLSAVVTGA